jgi:DNA polymerase/3'-5' exonuclease PolX
MKIEPQHREKLSKIFLELSEYAGLAGDTARAAAYQKAAGYTYTGIVNGPKMTAVAKEVISTGKCSELDALTRDPKMQSLKKLSAIIGVGPKTAHKWYEAGARDIISARKMAVELGLTNAQRLGLKYYYKLQQRIPRQIVRSVAARIEQAVRKLDKSAIFTVAGSYRRGQLDSGDIDILVCMDHPNISDIIENLRDNIVGVIMSGKERLSILYKDRLMVMQVDILNINIDSYYAALVYFTGSQQFNLRMRGYAKAQGYRLNQAGLYRLPNMENVRVQSERDVFEILHMEYLEPANRVR